MSKRDTHIPVSLKGKVFSVLKYGAGVFVFVVVVQTALGVKPETLSRTGEGLKGISVVAVGVRVLLALAIFSTGWKYVCRFVDRETGIDIVEYRYRALAWYAATEAVIIFYLYGAM